MQSESKYTRFLQWFTANGGRYGPITYPAYFPPTNYIGIAAAQPIPRHKVIISVPKQLIIGIQRVRQSQVGFLLQDYPCFQGEDNDDKDFNILTLYLIYEKMKDQASFFRPYFQCITIAETMVHWREEEIRALDSPFLSTSFLAEVRKEFEPTFAIFSQIASKHKNLFPKELTSDLFYFCYGIVMTRCFGWGLPETMLVPLADFLNHSAEGVHHYVFSQELEEKNHPDYIKKMRHLDLEVLGIDNKSKLPVGFEKDPREEYLEKNRPLLESMGLTMDQLNQAELRLRFKTLQAVKVQESYQNQIIPSSESQDNDSSSQSEEEEESGLSPEVLRYYRQKRFFKKLYELIDKDKQPVYEAPRPQINRQFDEDVAFGWWYSQPDSSFIVATSKALDKGEQIFNSYGRRSNRFLLLWYGFTYENNKYDSVPFRLWTEEVQRTTGQLVFTRFVTDLDWDQRIVLGDDRLSIIHLSAEFRLKPTEINYRLLAYLRFRIIRTKEKYLQLRNRYSELGKIMSLDLQLEVLQLYKKILGELINKYHLAQQRDFHAMMPWRATFSQILVHSDSEIVYRHCAGVERMIQVLENLKTEKPTLESLGKLYRERWEGNEVQRAIFLRYYFRLLQNYLSL